jgi:glutathione S-transferase
MANMCLYMAPGSCSTAAHIILEELEEVFEAHVISIPAGDNRRPEYLKINPRGTIPSLRLPDGGALTDLVAIVEWLGRNRRRGALWPSEPEKEARALSIMAHVTQRIHGEGFARVFVSGAYAADPEGKSFVERDGREIAAQGLAELATMLAPEGYALGKFGVVDAIIFYVEFWADKTHMALPPRLLDHYRLMLKRPAVYQVLREEGYDPARLGLGEAA